MGRNRIDAEESHAAAAQVAEQLRSQLEVARSERESAQKASEVAEASSQKLREQLEALQAQSKVC